MSAGTTSRLATSESRRSEAVGGPGGASAAAATVTGPLFLPVAFLEFVDVVHDILQPPGQRRQIAGRTGLALLGDAVAQCVEQLEFVAGLGGSGHAHSSLT